MMLTSSCSFFFFFNDTATTEIYTLSLHDALPILDIRLAVECHRVGKDIVIAGIRHDYAQADDAGVRRGLTGFFRSEEHTSELQSRSDLVCRLLLEKKKQIRPSPIRLSHVSNR